MIAKIVKGKGFRGALNYLFRDGRASIIGGNLSGRTPRELASEFGQFRKLRPALAKAVVHIPLSAHPEDRPLSDQEMAEIAERIAHGLGYDQSPCVFVRHHDTDHQHMHLVLCRVDRYGNAVSDSNDYRRAEALLRKIERDYRLKGVEAPAAKAPKKKKNQPKEDNMNQQQESHKPADSTEQEDSTADHLTMVWPEAMKTGNAGTKYKREARRRVLTSDYEEQLRALWGEAFRIYPHSNGLILYFDRPKQVRDEGSRVLAKGMDDVEAADKLVAIAKMKGWKAVAFTGTPSFVKTAIRQAMLAGLEVCASDPAQATLIDEVKAELSASALAVHLVAKEQGFADRLRARREMTRQEQSKHDQPDRGMPRFGP